MISLLLVRCVHVLEINAQFREEFTSWVRSSAQSKTFRRGLFNFTHQIQLALPRHFDQRKSGKADRDYVIDFQQYHFEVPMTLSINNLEKEARASSSNIPYTIRRWLDSILLRSCPQIYSKKLAISISSSIESMAQIRDEELFSVTGANRKRGTVISWPCSKCSRSTAGS